MVAAFADVAGALGFVASTEPFVRFTSAIMPYLPALFGAILALTLEAVIHWLERSANVNWWFVLGFGALAISLLIWESWRDGMPMHLLVDSPETAGRQFRQLIVGFGLMVAVTVLAMTYAGIRTTLECLPLIGVWPCALRLLPAPFLPILLAWYLHGAVRFFEGTAFRLVP